MDLNNNSKGQIAQLKCQLRAAEKNIITSLPLVPARYDLALDIDNKIIRAQIKYCDAKDHSKNTLILRLERKHLGQKSYDKNDIDLLLVFIPRIDKVLVFYPNQFHKISKIRINLKNPKSYNYWGKFIW